MKGRTEEGRRMNGECGRKEDEGKNEGREKRGEKDGWRMREEGG